MAKVYGLRALIYAKYDSESAFARAIGWSKQRLQRITNGLQVPNINDVYAIAVALGCTFQQVADAFFAQSHQTDNEGNSDDAE